MHFGWKILLMSAHEIEKQKEKDKTVLSFTETNLACFIIPSLMLTFQHLLGKPYILKTSWIQPYILNAWQSWAIAGIMNLGHQLMGVFFTLTSGIRDSFPVRTSFFVILKHKIYFTCILQLLFSLSSVSKLFFPSASSCNLFVWRVWSKFNCDWNCHWKTESRDCFLYSFLPAGAHREAVKKGRDSEKLLWVCCFPGSLSCPCNT